MMKTLEELTEEELKIYNEAIDYFRTERTYKNSPDCWKEKLETEYGLTRVDHYNLIKEIDKRSGYV